jgi:hypothetical protein
MRAHLVDTACLSACLHACVHTFHTDAHLSFGDFLQLGNRLRLDSRGVEVDETYAA